MLSDYITVLYVVRIFKQKIMTRTKGNIIVKLRTMYTKEIAIQNAINEADKKCSKGLLISCNHKDYDTLMTDPCTNEGDKETVYSIASLYSDDENNDGTWEDAILDSLEETYGSYF